jgi:hypothetical protein
MGKIHLSAKEYGKAKLCYAAVLQIIEGDGGTATDELRRRCGLTLAECEIKTGQLFPAIARCTEVIEECPNIEESSDGEGQTDAVQRERLRLALGKALYRRAVAFNKLSKPELALVDLKAALNNVQSDEKIQRQVEDILSSITSNSSISDPSTIPPEIEEQQRDVIEEAQANYPRERLSEVQLKSLLQKASRKKSSAESSSPFADMKLDGGLADLLSGSDNSASFGDGGLGSMLGGLGGLGAGNLGSMLGGLGKGGGGGLIGSLGTILPLFGVDPATASYVGEIAKAVSEAFSVLKRGYDFINKYKTQIVFAGIILWAVVSAWPMIVPTLLQMRK